VRPQTPTRTGPRSQTSLSVDAFRTALLSATTVSILASYLPDPSTDSLVGKKLKKRLEDLERRAASSSASPEQKPAELQQPTNRSPRQEFPSPASSDSEFGRRTPEMQSYHIPAPEERGMFSHQYTRQLSTSPPPFSYSTYPAPDTAAYTVPYAASTAPYHSIPTTTTPEMPMYTPYLPPLSSAYPTTLPSLVHPMKSEYYAEDISPFGVGYSAMAGLEEIHHHAYPESDAHVKLPPRKPYYAH
jgi:hypothetical protein